MFDSRRYIGTGAVLALVLLRLVVGWHFFTEGTEKIEVDRQTHEVRMTFTAAPFLLLAKGPLAEFFYSQAASGHDWHILLAEPKENAPLKSADAKEQAAWVSDYQRRLAEAEKSRKVLPAEFPPFAGYRDWATRIVEDWQSLVISVKNVAGLSEEQKQAAENAFAERSQQLADYLEGEREAIADYQHELSRLANWAAKPEAGSVPFEQQRIAKKTAETAASPRPWVAQVEQLDMAFRNDLSGILTSEQRTQAAVVAAMDDATSLPNEKWLHNINWIVTILTIGVGVCLLLGFFTRLASLAGALFLLGVIATQPPWVADAAPTIAQGIELAALLVLAGTGAGRWLGLDYFTYALFGRFRHADETA